MLNPVAVTGLLVAAIRAEETRRAAPLFTDLFADRLAGDEGRAALAAYRLATGGAAAPIIEVRTRFYDDTLTRIAAAGLHQFVLLAAGMDARAYRLRWPPGARVFELDQPAVLAHKSAILADDRPTCDRISVPIDLVDDWPAALLAAGFDPTKPTCFTVEGLLQYLERPAIDTLLTRLDRLAAPGSRLLYDVVGQILLNAPFMAGATRMMREHGAPWLFGSDAPETLIQPHGWTAEVSDIGTHAVRHGRWPIPTAPGPGGPRGYLVVATNH